MPKKVAVKSWINYCAGSGIKGRERWNRKKCWSYTDGAAAFLTKVPNLTDDNTKEMNWENSLLIVKKEHALLIKTGGKTSSNKENWLWLQKIVVMELPNKRSWWYRWKSCRMLICTSIIVPRSIVVFSVRGLVLVCALTESFHVYLIHWLCTVLLISSHCLSSFLTLPGISHSWSKHFLKQLNYWLETFYECWH